MGSIPPSVSNYLKSLSQEAKDLMDEIDDANDDTYYNKLLFIGSNKVKFDFNIFSTPSNFLLDIFNGKITLKKAEINQRDLNKKIEELKYNYKPKNEKEKEEINEVLMHANDMLEYGDKIIEAFRDGTFSSEHLKKSDAAAYDYILEDVNNLFRKLNQWQKKKKLHLFKDFFFESPSPADYAKMLINTKNPDENKEIVPEIEHRISDLKDNKKNE